MHGILKRFSIVIPLILTAGIATAQEAPTADAGDTTRAAQDTSAAHTSLHDENTPAGAPVAEPPASAVPEASADPTPASYGVPVFPGAEPRPEVARAINAYYAPSAGAQRVTVGAFDTPAAFDEVSRFYGSRMDRGKRGWRVKTLPLEHQTRAVGLLRSQLAAGSGLEGTLPGVFEPLFGDPELSQEEFERALQALVEQNPDAEIEFAEGVRRISGDPDGSTVRITVSRPIIDSDRMELVPATRVVLIKVTPSEAAPAGGNSSTSGENPDTR